MFSRLIASAAPTEGRLYAEDLTAMKETRKTDLLGANLGR
jgi:hypothetical protein